MHIPKTYLENNNPLSDDSQLDANTRKAERVKRFKIE